MQNAPSLNIGNYKIEEIKEGANFFAFKIKGDAFYIYERSSNKFYKVKNNTEFKEFVKRNKHRKINLIFPFNKREIIKELNKNISRLILYASDVCNLRCKYCYFSDIYEDSRIFKGKKMSLELMKKSVYFYITHSYERAIKTISFYGGEPFLNWDNIMSCILFYVKNYSIKNAIFSISTNLTYPLTQKDIAFLVQNNVILQVSLDGPSEIHNKCRVFPNGKGTFDVVYNNLKRIYVFSKQYFQNFVGITVVLHPYTSLKKIYEFFTSNPLVSNVKVFRVTPVRDYDKISKISFFKDAKQRHIEEENFIFEEYIKTLRNKNFNSVKYKFLNSFYLKLFKSVHLRKQGNFNSFLLNRICIPGVNRLTVDTEGNFYPCEKDLSYFIIGNIETGFNYEYCFNMMQKYYEFVEHHCEKCWALYFCPACFLNAVSEKGIFDKNIFIKSCKNIKNQISLTLIRYVTTRLKYEKIFDYI